MHEHGLPENRTGAWRLLLPAHASASEAPHHAEAEGVVEVAIGQQVSVGSDDRASKPEHESAVEIEFENAID
jgi:hypothetical protein